MLHQIPVDWVEIPLIVSVSELFIFSLSFDMENDDNNSIYLVKGLVLKRLVNMYNFVHLISESQLIW